MINILLKVWGHSVFNNYHWNYTGVWNMCNPYTNSRTFLSYTALYHCLPLFYGIHPWQQGSWGQHGAHLGPTGPWWAPCWPHELCYLGCYPFEVLLHLWAKQAERIYQCYYDRFKHTIFLTLVSARNHKNRCNTSQIARYMEPTWVLSAPCWPHEPCYQGWFATDLQ